MVRAADLITFYGCLSRLSQTTGVASLASTARWPALPTRGVYFFFEPGETRTETGGGLRVVRVGTHALREGSGTTLWGRLRQHRGVARSGGGNHRGSIFRLLIGAALAARDSALLLDSWGQKPSASAEVRRIEAPLERKVSETVGRMSIVALAVPDEPGPSSLRGYVERNTIALLSSYGHDPIDLPSPGWLGRSCPRQRVRSSGLWNNNHVDQRTDPDFLERFDLLVNEAVTGGRG